MPYTGDPQPEAGRIIRLAREDLGLGVQDFCQLVSRVQTKWGRVSITRSTLQRIECGQVPGPPRKYAVAHVLGMDQDDIWHRPGARLYRQTTKGATR